MLDLLIRVTVLPLPGRQPRTIAEAKELGRWRADFRAVAAEIARELQDIIQRHVQERVG